MLQRALAVAPEERKALLRTAISEARNAPAAAAGPAKSYACTHGHNGFNLNDYESTVTISGQSLTVSGDNHGFAVTNPSQLKFGWIYMGDSGTQKEKSKTAMKGTLSPDRIESGATLLVVDGKKMRPIYCNDDGMKAIYRYINGR